jgi:hypothetical protein
MKPPPSKPDKTEESGTEAPRNVAVRVLESRTKIGTAICAAGRLDFPLTQADAEALQALGKVEIIGIF